MSSYIQGFRVVQGFECWHKSLTPLMEEVRAMMGSGPVYISFDIDALDPSFAPGTGKCIDIRVLKFVLLQSILCILFASIFRLFTLLI